MNPELLAKLSIITDEEQAILNGKDTVNRSIYYREDGLSKRNEIDAALLLEKGKLIDMRPSTRFIHFPEHTHNFVECVYMCSGTTTHRIDGHTIRLEEGDLLFMNQHARQEILPAGRSDIAVNFIILPQFFDTVLRNIPDASPVLRDFLISCLTDRDMGGNYLYFNAAGILPVQNLMENLVWIMENEPRNRRTLSQQTMALLFLHLMDNTDRIHMAGSSWEQDLILRLLNYIDGEYKEASLTEFAARNSIDIYTLGRLIHKHTGHTFIELLANRRMNQAAYLLTSTRLPVSEVSLMIGYENTSYFHRLFQKAYGCTPRHYREGHSRQAGTDSNPDRQIEHEAARYALCFTADPHADL